jgi:predicted TIM-barrel fold metal-dependent hydrolase
MQATTLPISGIDSHAHVFLKDLPWSEGRRYAPSYDASLELYQSQLAMHGLSHGVLIQPSFLGTDNRYLIDCLDRFPDQFRGVAVVNPAEHLTLIDEYDAKGVVGVRANLIGMPTPDFAGGAWQVMFARMQALDWHLEVQVEAARLPEISRIVLQSGVRLVVDHFGRFDPDLNTRDPGLQNLIALGETQQVWVKFSGAYRVSPRVGNRQTGLQAGSQTEREAGREADRFAGEKQIVTTARAAFSLLKDAFGIERLVWGSDWPHTTFEDSENFESALTLFNEVVTDAAERQVILTAVPRDLFHF